MIRRMHVPVLGPTTQLFEFPKPIRAFGALSLSAALAGGERAVFMGCNGWFRGVAVEKDRAGRVIGKRLVAAQQGGSR